jgi:hypothetical protein
MAMSLEARVSRQEKQNAERRLTAAGGQRLASPLMPQHGHWLGILEEDLNQGGTASVAIWVWDPDEEEWTSRGSVVVRDWFLNAGETAPGGSKCEIFYYINTWVFRTIYCAASDNVGVPE